MSLRLTIFFLLLFSSLTGHGQGDGLFASRAVAVGFGASVLSPDGRLRISVAEIDSATDDGFSAMLRVQVGRRVLERRFNFGLNAQVLWSPDGARFALTGSNGGAVGQFETAIVTVGEKTLYWLDVTKTIERAFGHPVKCGWPEPPNVGAVAWLSDTRLLIAAEIMPHSNCDSMGTFVVYRFALSSRRAESRYGQLEAKKRWRSQLGVELLAAPDECIRKPPACFVPLNHPDREAPSRPQPNKRLQPTAAGGMMSAAAAEGASSDR